MIIATWKHTGPQRNGWMRLLVDLVKVNRLVLPMNCLRLRVQKLWMLMVIHKHRLVELQNIGLTRVADITLTNMNDAVRAALQHPDTLGAGAAKRKHLDASDTAAALTDEYKRGTLRSGSGAYVRSE